MYELLKTNGGYGVRVGTTSVPDISGNREDVEALLRLLEENSADETHVYDVIEDWFGTW